MTQATARGRLPRQLFERLAEARARTDQLFGLLRPEALYQRPVPERHRFIFYLGHLEAFDWNLLGRQALGLESFHPEFDRLFAFGIDPVDGGLPADQPSDWPPQGVVADYNRRVRQALDEALRKVSLAETELPLLRDGLALEVVIEHRLMHAETLAYLLHQVPLEGKFAPPVAPAPASPTVVPRMARIPAGRVTLGQRPGAFGWDNELPQRAAEVPEFEIDVYNVTNRQFLEFVESGGYQDRSLWSDADWQWVCAQGIRHPGFWTRRGEEWLYRAMFAELPLPLDWPVYVSHAEASAYARWAGKSLPTEAQWHRAACGTPEGAEREYPWGDDSPGPPHGNFDFTRWDPAPVGAYPAGQSAFGVFDLVGNGWEWTSTLFETHPGFAPFPFYPGYSADFFDGRHYVMKGGSARTAACLLRRSYRNWFQPHYPYVYASFRCVSDGS